MLLLGPGGEGVVTASAAADVATVFDVSYRETRHDRREVMDGILAALFEAKVAPKGGRHRLCGSLLPINIRTGAKDNACVPVDDKTQLEEICMGMDCIGRPTSRGQKAHETVSQTGRPPPCGGGRAGYTT